MAALDEKASKPGYRSAGREFAAVALGLVVVGARRSLGIPEWVAAAARRRLLPQPQKASAARVAATL
jgi:hypothetical protein